MSHQPHSEKKISADTSFRLRSTEISRIEGFSDAVLAFAVTLLIISLEVPTTFNELLEKMHGFAAFAISFAMLFWVWFNHYTFCRRYGLENSTTAWLTAAMLFVVLFYVYPLKFLFTWLVIIYSGGNPVTHLEDGSIVRMVGVGQNVTLMIVYGIGFVAVFTVFFFLYRHAYKRRGELELNELEILLTKGSIQSYIILICIGMLSLLIAAIGRTNLASFLSGITYALIGPAMAIHGAIMGKKKRTLLKKMSNKK
ncbi:MAG: DUF1211 domain-containing protein [Ignavibacteriales bacterium]|nr:DUF1211 domain-containing protein [Ignavibacteriales bacterium]